MNSEQIVAEALPILYSFRRCPYAMRARMAIAVSHQHCALREIVLRDKPADMITASPKATVPVLVLPDGQVLDESLDVMFWALNQSDPEGWLVSLKNNEAETQSLIAENDGPFKQNLDRYKYATRYENINPTEHRQAGLVFLQKLDQILTNQPYLCGRSFTLADAAIVPFVRQYVHTDRNWFLSTQLNHVTQWLDTFLGSQRFLSVMAKYPVWQQGMREPVFPDQL